jgi:hypothetical protein
MHLGSYLHSSIWTNPFCAQQTRQISTALSDLMIKRIFINNTFNIKDKHIFCILLHGLFITPMIFRVCYIPTFRKFVFRLLFKKNVRILSDYCKSINFRCIQFLRFLPTGQIRRYLFSCISYCAKAKKKVLFGHIADMPLKSTINL